MSGETGLQLLAWSITLLSVWAVFRLLFRRGWLGPWIRGNLGVALLLLGFMAASLALDLRDYSHWQNQETVAQLRLTEFKPQVFIATLSIPGRSDQRFELRGDEWQLDVRVISWRGLATKMGLQPLYRLGRLSGRYLTLQQARNAPRFVHEIGDSNYRIDTWKLLHKTHQYLPWIRPQYGSAVYMPMTHNARYDIVLTRSGLLAQPANDVAEQATDTWQ